MKTVIGGVVNTVGVELIPVVEDIINQIKNWVLANGSLIAQDIKNFIKKSIPVIKDIAEAIVFVVTGIKDLIEALGGWKPAMAIATTATRSAGANTGYRPGYRGDASGACRHGRRIRRDSRQN